MFRLCTILSIACVVFATSSTVQAYNCSSSNVSNNKCFGLIKLNSAAALGECLPDGRPSNVEAMLKRNNITGFTGAIPADKGQSDKSVKNPSSLSDLEDSRMDALTRVVGALDKIGNGNMSALRNGSGIQVIFAGPGTTSPNSRRHGNQIQLAPGGQNQTGMQGKSTCGGVDNMGLIAHEIGHFIGGNNNRENYNSYNAAMSAGPCRLSQYSVDKGPVEEFAEVVAAYITHPEAFIDKGANCRRAFNYMKRLFGEPDMTMSCEARKKSYDATSTSYAGRDQELLRNVPFMPTRVRLKFSPNYYKNKANLLKSSGYPVPFTSDEDAAIN